MPDSTNPLSSFVVPNSDPTHYTPTTAEPLDLDALESVARFAHPQDGWEAGDVWVFTSPVYADDNRLSDVLGMKFEDDERADAERARGLANAAYIAAAQPSTVLALIAALKEARAGLADAWDEGCVAGRNREHHTNMTREQAEATWPNPYRRTETP